MARTNLSSRGSSRAISPGAASAREMTSGATSRREPPRAARSRPAVARPRFRYGWLLAMGLIAACSGDGCSGCGGCGGITPLAGGFVNEERIENAASVRVTEDGFNFLEDNIGTIAGNLVGGGKGGVVEFEIPESSGEFDVFITTIGYTICPGGPDAMGNPKKCAIEIDMGKSELSIQPGGPHTITVSGIIPVRLQYLPVETDICDIEVVLNSNDACPGEQQAFAPVGVTLVVSLETDLDTNHARYGYSRVRINEVTISQPDIEAAVGFCGGFCSQVADFFSSFVVDQAFGALQDTLVGTVEEQLCQKASTVITPVCPNGTNDVNGICRYGTTEDAECVSIVLGSDGHANLSGLLAGISPGTKGGLDFVLAAGGQSQRDDASGFTWGDLNPINNGASISAFGGVEPNPVSQCVPLSSLARPSGLKIPNELIDDSLITDWPLATGPHIGIGLSESFANYAMSGLYNSGLFCIGITTEAVSLLNSGTLGLLAQSLKDLGLQRETQPIAIVIKPTQTPKITFGNGTNLDTDPLIRIELDQADFDFYTFSSDRYIRFMTARFDIEVPMNLTVTPEGLVPVIQDLKIENGEVKNSQLLKEDPAGIAASLQGLLASQIGGLIGGGLPAIDLNGALSGIGLQLVIPETVEGQGSPGLRTLTKDGERYLGIFANMQIGSMMQFSAETNAEITDVTVDKGGLRPGTITADNAPEITLLASVDNALGQPVEYQVRIDEGMWRPWTSSRYLRVKSESLRVEGKHQIEVRSRIVGQPYTLDASPETFEVIIDTEPPVASLAPVQQGGQARLDVRDLVSREATLVRYRFDDGSFSGWIASGELPSIAIPEDAEEIEIEAKDENGNVGTAQQAIIRGLPHGDAGGCGCVVVGTSSDSRWPLGLLGVALLGSLSLRRKRNVARRAGQALVRWARGGAATRAAGAVAVLGVAGSWSGCSCDETKPDPEYSCVDACYTLQPGLIGSYTGADVDSKGGVWVSGYLEADYDSAYASYGDLVVGKLDGDKVAWEIVDGVPTSPEPDGKITNIEGFRGGQTLPGDDVGLWTSLAINPGSDQPSVAYYDRTNKALKFAVFNGEAWEISVVRDEPEADVGRYAKLFYEGNTPMIAFMSIEPAASGMLVSGVKLARGTTNGFTIEDVAANDATPCRAGLCTGGTSCVEGDGVCAPSGSACGECAGGEACVSVGGSDQCKVIISTPRIEAYPIASGLYISVAPLPGGGFGIAYYDRVAGTVNVAAQGDGGWTVTTVEGGVAADGTAGDAGVGTSLAIDDSGVWHLAYVDGYNEALKYARVANGAVDVTEVVDAGFEVSGVAHPDGQHVVGDDSFIHVTPQGTIQISYQDASSGKLRLANGTPNATGGNDWDVKVIDTDNFGGFFSRQIEAEGSIQVVHWWRKLVPGEDGVVRGVGDVSVLGL